MSPFERAVRYYAIGGLNTVFGFSVYSLLIWLGLNLYVAQLIAHVCGTTFNYFTYSWGVFPGDERRPVGFVGAYIYSYVQGLILLAIAHHFVANPYIDGLLTLIVGTAINYFVLRRFAFRPREAPPDVTPT
jgi:putative flippase GtrA